MESQDSQEEDVLSRCKEEQLKENGRGLCPALETSRLTTMMMLIVLV